MFKAYWGVKKGVYLGSFFVHADDLVKATKAAKKTLKDNPLTFGYGKLLHIMEVGVN